MWAGRMYPLEKYKGFIYPKEVGLNHRHRWVDAILEGGKTSDGFDYAGPLTETVYSSAMQPRVLPRRTSIPSQAGMSDQVKSIQWDAENMKIPNSPRRRNTSRRPIAKVGKSSR